MCRQRPSMVASGTCCRSAPASQCGLFRNPGRKRITHGEPALVRRGLQVQMFAAKVETASEAELQPPLRPGSDPSGVRRRAECGRSLPDAKEDPKVARPTPRSMQPNPRGSIQRAFPPGGCAPVPLSVQSPALGCRRRARKLDRIPAWTDPYARERHRSAIPSNRRRRDDIQIGVIEIENRFRVAEFEIDSPERMRIDRNPSGIAGTFSNRNWKFHGPASVLTRLIWWRRSRFRLENSSLRWNRLRHAQTRAPEDST